MLGNIDGQGSLAHRGPGSQNDQVASLKASSQAIEVIKAAGNSGHIVRVVRHLLDPVHEFHHQRLHGLESLLGAGTFFADIEDFLLGFVEDGGDRPPPRVEGTRRNFIAGTHQLAQNAPLTHDLGVAPDIA